MILRTLSQRLLPVLAAGLLLPIPGDNGTQDVIPHAQISTAAGKTPKLKKIVQFFTFDKKTKTLSLDLEKLESLHPATKTELLEFVRRNHLQFYNSISQRKQPHELTREQVDKILSLHLTHKQKLFNDSVKKHAPRIIDLTLVKGQPILSPEKSPEEQRKNHLLEFGHPVFLMNNEIFAFNPHSARLIQYKEPKTGEIKEAIKLGYLRSGPGLPEQGRLETTLLPADLTIVLIHPEGPEEGTYIISKK